MSGAATVTKQEFPYLLAKLWDVSFLPEHFISGFRKAGLCPFSRESISPTQLNKALPISKPRPAVPPKSQPTVPSDDSNAVSVELVGTCTIKSAVTPIRLHLRGYFSQLLQKNRERSTHPADKRKVKPRFYGEALTVDEIYERLVEEARLKEQTKKQKKQKPRKASPRPRGCKISKKKSANSPGKHKMTLRVRGHSRSSSTGNKSTPTESDTETCNGRERGVASDSEEESCQECHERFMDNDDEAKQCWMGCDTCERWFHYYCVGLGGIPDGFWSCQYCSVSD